MLKQFTLPPPHPHPLLPVSIGPVAFYGLTLFMRIESIKFALPHKVIKCLLIKAETLTPKGASWNEMLYFMHKSP
jgi:hypothetical protein